MRTHRLLLLLAMALPAQSATRFAASASYPDVNNAVNGVGTMSSGTSYSTPAQDGDIVNVPAGTATWASTLSVTKNIELLGAGESQTVILEKLSRSGSPALIDVQLSHDSASALPYSFHLSGFTFDADAGASTTFLASDHGFLNLIGRSSASNNPAPYVLGCVSRVRVDHLTFRTMSGLYIWVDSVLGVGDHITTASNNNYPFKIVHSAWTPATNPNPGAHLNETQSALGGFGFGSWADDPYYNSDKFWFYEDCNLTVGTNVWDIEGGGRGVLRHCTVTGGSNASHGAEGGPTGVREAQIYNNYMDAGASSAYPQTRSGNLIWFNNLCRNWQTVGANGCLPLQTYRLDRTEPNWGHASGNNRYDDNGGTNNAPLATLTGTTSAATGASQLTDGATDFRTFLGGSNFANNGFIYAAENGNAPSGIAGSPTSLDAGWNYKGATVASVSTDGHTLNLMYDLSSGAAGTARGTGWSPTWSIADPYTIRKCKVAFEQPGHGKHRYILSNPGAQGATANIGTAYNTYFVPYTSGDAKAINPGVSDATFPLEPCYSWNNESDTGTRLDIYDKDPSLVSGTDFINKTTLQTAAASNSPWRKVGYNPTRDFADATATFPGIGPSGATAFTPLTYPHPLQGSSPPSATNRWNHIFIVVLENLGYPIVVGDNTNCPYLNGTLIPQGILYSNHHGLTHPSQGNYVALFSGSLQGIYDSATWSGDHCPWVKEDGTGGVPFNAPNMYSALKNNGGYITKGYFEGIDLTTATNIAKCSNGSATSLSTTFVATEGQYVRKHNPLIDFNLGNGSANDVPTSALDKFPPTSIGTAPGPGGTATWERTFSWPAVSWIMPNIPHDMHVYNGHTSTQAQQEKQGDEWLRTYMPDLIAYCNDSANKGLIILTMDEGDNPPTANQILTFLVGYDVKAGGALVSGAQPGGIGTLYDHYSTLRTVLNNFAVPTSALPGAAATASVMNVPSPGGPTPTPAPVFTSANNATFVQNTAGTFTASVTSNPIATLTKTGTLPTGVTFTASGNSATIAGTPTNSGTFPLTLSAANTGGTTTQAFTLTVSAAAAAPVFTSANNATFVQNAAGTFTVTVTSSPTATLTKTGTLPTGVTFSAAGNTATIAGTPTNSGTFPLTITATNTGGTTTQSFSLVVSPTDPFAAAPCGAWYLVSGATGVNATQTALISNPDVDGVAVHVPWNGVTGDGVTYTWGALDGAVQAAADAGKPCRIRVTTGGPGETIGNGSTETGDKPDFVINACLSAGDKFFLNNAGGVTDNIPVYWSPTLLAKHKALIAAMGAHFTSNPTFDKTIKVVGAAALNGSTDDWRIPDSGAVDGLPPTGSSEKSRWVAAGYTQAKCIDAAEQIIDATMTAFPKQFVMMSFGTTNAIAPGDNGDDQYMAQQIITYARNKWPGRFLVQKDNLSAKVTKYGDPGWDTANWGQVGKNPPDNAQMVWHAFNDTTNRMRGTSTANANLTEDEVLRKAVDLGVSYKTGYQEIYELDLKNLPNAFTYAHQQLACGVVLPTKPVFTSATSVIFQQNQAAAPFTVAVTSSPAATLSESGLMPTGITFTPSGNNATLAGTPTNTGTFPVTFSATNAGGTTTQAFTFTVQTAATPTPTPPPPTPTPPANFIIRP